ncbi:cation:proton antiporter [Brevibacterium album]|uniref:cation:proton antiporter n=1 Tax=Brevibacterium album TaxID=417948 RepID=UPI0003F69965|nr:monovalent cation/H(+) antiporter subunit G [Brevibacterium album]
MTALTLAGDVLVIAGALVFATAALGLLRFPDAYTRISAVGTAGGLGIVLVITGAFLHRPSVPAAVMVVLAVLLQLTTSAVGSMAIARSALLVRTPLSRLRFSELHDESGAEAEPDGGEPPLEALRLEETIADPGEHSERTG